MAEFYTIQFGNMQYQIDNEKDHRDFDTLSRGSEESVEDHMSQFKFHGIPTCFSKGMRLHPHQVESLKWMSILYENEVNGILADDMVS